MTIRQSGFPEPRTTKVASLLRHTFAAKRTRLPSYKKLMTDRNGILNVMPVCPFCGGEVEIGCLMGKDSLFAFQWYKGDPSFWKNLIPHGQSVGATDLLHGTHMTGVCCLKCRKIVLEY